MNFYNELHVLLDVYFLGLLYCQLNIDNHIEFAKTFQVGSKKIKNIKKIFFDLEKKIGETNFTIKNVKIYSLEKNKNLNEVFFIKNIQNLRSHIRKIID